MLLLLCCAGILVELLLLAHCEDNWQRAPLAILALLLALGHSSLPGKGGVRQGKRTVAPRDRLGAGVAPGNVPAAPGAGRDDRRGAPRAGLGLPASGWPV